MSKSLGNVIDPLQVIDGLGADALRFYLLREVQLGQDGSVTREGLDRRYEGELANDLGQPGLAGDGHDRPLPRRRVPEGRPRSSPCTTRVAERFDALDLTGALEEIWVLVRAANRYVEERRRGRSPRATSRPTSRARHDAVHAGRRRARAGRAASPVHPAASERMLDAVGDPGAVGWERAGLGLSAAGTAVEPAAAALPGRRRRRVIDTHAHLDMCDGDAGGPRRRRGRGRSGPHPHGRPRAGGRAGRAVRAGLGDRRLPSPRGGRGRPTLRRRCGRCSGTRGRSRSASAASTSTATTRRATTSCASSPPRSSSRTRPGCRW